MGKKKSNSILSNIQAFLPIHLIFSLMKYNLISLFYWAFLFLIIWDPFNNAFGVPYLFLSPEYLGSVNGWSFALLGFSFGGFTMAFNTYSYIKLGPRYPFLATVSRPFFKFCINNSLIPLLFLLYYVIKMIYFQRIQEFQNWWIITFYSMCIFLGFLTFILLSIFYFFPTTKEQHNNDQEDEKSSNPIQTVIPNKDKWYDYFRTEKDRNYFYIGKNYTIQQSRSTKHLDKSIIEKVFSQNRINASIFEILSIFAFIIMGFFIDYPIFEFPAAMSIVLLLTILHMVFSALMSWFHRWTYPLLFLLLIMMNYLSIHTRLFTYKNYAYGLDYSNSNKRDYDIKTITKLSTDTLKYNLSKSNATAILNNWKNQTGEQKPKLIIVNTSGGGSRSALWTFTVLQKCDQILNNKLGKNIQLITGASGGMIGASYYRELLLKEKNTKNFNRFDSKYFYFLSKDLLNRLAFSLSTTDLFFRYHKFTYNNRKYNKDRGQAFEQHLHKNTENLMDHPFGFYQTPEYKAIVPMLIFSPTIVNDGRRLLISTQPMNYLCSNNNQLESFHYTYENIDYLSFFEANDPLNIRFSSIMRSSATFPFIMPMITMPSNPEIQLMDAGLRDNYGCKITIDYILSHADWIQKNTSGVLILEIRDTKRILKKELYPKISFFDKFTLPFGNMYSNFPRTQDFDQEQLLRSTANGLPFNFDIITFNLRESKDDKIALSWHLTKHEKKRIIQSINHKNNKNALIRLRNAIQVTSI